MKAWLAVLLLGLSAQAQSGETAVPNYQPVTPKQRVKWFVETTVGPTSMLFTGPSSAALGTALNAPKEYGPHWDGFAKRYGIRLTGISVGNAIEGGLGAAWGEDPRYFRSPEHGFGQRVRYVIKASFMAPYRDGQWHPAYARYIGIVGNNFLSNTWRVPSESTPEKATVRSVYGVAAEIGSNALMEFWPDVEKKVFHHK